MVRLTTGSRLHFGLLALRGANSRFFGGAGLMIESPGVSVAVEPAPSWSSSGPAAARALDFARHFVASCAALPPDTAFSIRVEQCAAEHTGLGTGTQLGLAVAAALAEALQLRLTAVELARHIGRGERSAIGIHGFEQGGFLI